jgi:hypothetical protein
MDFAMTGDRRGYQRFTFIINAPLERFKDSLSSLKKHQSKIVMVGALGFSAFAITFNVPERIIALLDFLAVVWILAKELTDGNRADFKSEHDYYVKALESFYENGSFSAGHSSMEIMKFYRSNFKIFIDSLDDHQEEETLELIAGTLPEKEVNNLKKEAENKNRFAGRLLLALDRRNHEKDEFDQTHYIYFNALNPDTRDRSKLLPKEFIWEAIDFYDSASSEFIHFLPYVEKVKIAEWLANELTTKKERDRFLKSREGVRGSIKWLMFDDLMFKRAKEAAAKLEGKTPSSPAMIAQTPEKNGGIDFNASNMQMNVRKEGNGVGMRFDPAMIERMKTEGFDGLEFNIRSIVPVTDLPILLALKQPASSSSVE